MERVTQTFQHTCWNELADKIGVEPTELDFDADFRPCFDTEDDIKCAWREMVACKNKRIYLEATPEDPRNKEATTEFFGIYWCTDSEVEEFQDIPNPEDFQETMDTQDTTLFLESEVETLGYTSQVAPGYIIY